MPYKQIMRSRIAQLNHDKWLIETSPIPEGIDEANLSDQAHREEAELYYISQEIKQLERNMKAMEAMEAAVEHMLKSVANMMLVVEQCSADTIIHERYNEDSCRPGWEEDYNNGGF